MKPSRLFLVALLATLSVEARDPVVPLTSKSSPKTYYSYSYKPGGGSTVHASGFTHRGGFHLNSSTISSGTSSSSVSNWKSKANSAASKWSNAIKLPSVK
jgi:hypothetical protein